MPLNQKDKNLDIYNLEACASVNTDSTDTISSNALENITENIVTQDI